MSGRIEILRPLRFHRAPPQTRRQVRIARTNAEEHKARLSRLRDYYASLCLECGARLHPGECAA